MLQEPSVSETGKTEEYRDVKVNMDRSESLMKINCGQIYALKRLNGRIFTLLLSSIGAACALASALFLLNGLSSPVLLTSLGGSTIFLYAFTEAEAAQPRALFGGHIGAALIGIIFYNMFGDAVWVYVTAVVFTMVYMILSGTIHPPAGANPLLMISCHADITMLVKPVLLGVMTLFLVTMFWSYIRPGKTYPVKWW